MTRLTKISILLVVFFAVDKVVALLRQVIIARQFGLSAELDVFNVANNVPDLLFALISGGALAMAFIPVLTEVMTGHGRRAAWDLFSRVANLAFVVTVVLAFVVGIFADSLVGWEIGIAPGFSSQQQALVVSLMRLNLVATIIFSISGLAMAGLQANQHFFLPALAPILYNIGQIFGALVLAPEKGLSIGPIILPAMGMGVYGLVWGVIIGACFHLLIQVPGLVHFGFHWKPEISIHDAEVRKVLRVLGPRLLTVMIVQLIFLVRDNLASRLAEGAVTALTYGWMLQQMPETLIGTALGTAILPTLAEYVSRNEQPAFQDVIEKAVRIGLALSIPAAVILSISLGPLIGPVFNFDTQESNLLLWTTRGYLLGLMGHCVLEVAARSFYAQQDALTPLFGGLINLGLYILAGSQLYRHLGAPGVSLTDSIAFSFQALFLVWMLSRNRSARKTAGSVEVRIGKSVLPGLNQLIAWLQRQDNPVSARLKLGGTVIRSLAGGIAGGLAAFCLLRLAGGENPNLVSAVAAIGAGEILSLPFILPEIRLLLKF